MHRVFDGEDSDDAVEDLDGAVDYLSDKRKEEEVKESDIFSQLVAVAVIQHALVTRRRLVFDPLGSTRAGSRVQPGSVKRENEALKIENERMIAEMEEMRSNHKEIEDSKSFQDASDYEELRDAQEDLDDFSNLLDKAKDWHEGHEGKRRKSCSSVCKIQMLQEAIESLTEKYKDQFQEKDKSDDDWGLTTSIFALVGKTQVQSYLTSPNALVVCPKSMKEVQAQSQPKEVKKVMLERGEEEEHPKSQRSQKENLVSQSHTPNRLNGLQDAEELESNIERHLQSGQEIEDKSGPKTMQGLEEDMDILIEDMQSSKCIEDFEGIRDLKRDIGSKGVEALKKKKIQTEEAVFLEKVQELTESQELLKQGLASCKKLLENKKKSSARLVEWRDEWFNVLQGEMIEMNTLNATLESSNRVLLNRVTACKRVEERIKEMSEEELDIDGWYLASVDVEQMQVAMREYMKGVWEHIKVNMYDVVKTISDLCRGRNGGGELVCAKNKIMN
ncbi:hypothetical protein L7F22_045681 [Adiantum nelumboides]|nr:hypothetical protein [Adiantum nelumboides]